jgi:hypothetical protein
VLEIENTVKYFIFYILNVAHKQTQLLRNTEFQAFLISIYAGVFGAKRSAREHW